MRVLTCLCIAQVASSLGADPGSKIVLVYAVNRHGTRNLLPKRTQALSDAPLRQAFGGERFPNGRMHKLRTSQPSGEQACMHASEETGSRAGE
jgi:hypothetical protein